MKQSMSLASILGVLTMICLRNLWMTQSPTSRQPENRHFEISRSGSPSNARPEDKRQAYEPFRIVMVLSAVRARRSLEVPKTALALVPRRHRPLWRRGSPSCFAAILLRA